MKVHMLTGSVQMKVDIQINWLFKVMHVDLDWTDYVNWICPDES